MSNEDKIEVINFRLLPGNGRSLKAFADVQLPDGTVIRDLRVIESLGKRAHVLCPQTSFRDPSGQLVFRTIITFPDRLMGEIELLILNEWNREKERRNGSPQE